MKLTSFPSDQTLVSPSILAADFANLENQLHDAFKAGAQLIHLDVMDGHFVPNISFGPPVIASLRSKSEAIFDAHLMISHPQKYIEEFHKAGCDHITFHLESDCDALEVIELIHSFGMSAGISIKPGTEPELILPYLDKIEMLLIMTVEPGFGGQSFMPEMIERIKLTRKHAEMVNPALHIQVDGGIKAANAQLVKDAGSNCLVAGTAFFKHPEGMNQAFSELAK